VCVALFLAETAQELLRIRDLVPDLGEVGGAAALVDEDQEEELVEQQSTILVG